MAVVNQIPKPNCVHLNASIIVVLLFLALRPASSFSLGIASPLKTRCKRNPMSAAAVGTDSSPAAASPDTKRSIQETSDELLRILRRKVSGTTAGGDERKAIDALTQTLVESRTPFDPAVSINGPLFASVHTIGDTPLWERIGMPGWVAKRNVKGQKISLGEGGPGAVVNYAEIWGDSLYLTAVGGCEAKGPILDEVGPSSDKAFGGALLPTPYDYSATVTGASIELFKKFSINLSIEGTGTVRVLYADENLRIFLSPTDTNVTRGGGDWESKGLIAIQVRVDLVYGDWIDRL